MKQSFIVILAIAFLSVLDCNSQNIDNIRGTNWICLDYIRDMENWLPCECYDTVNYCYYISIAEELFAEDSKDEKFIPAGILNYVVQTEPTQFYIINADSTRYGISVDSENIDFELMFKGDTLLLIDNISSKKFIKSAIPFDFFSNKHTYSIDNIALLNKSFSMRGYPTIQTILKADSLAFDCNAWVGNINIIYSRAKRKYWVLEIYDGFLYISKVTNPLGDPLDPIKTKVIKKLKWITNGKERKLRREEFPVWVSPK